MQAVQPPASPTPLRCHVTWQTPACDGPMAQALLRNFSKEICLIHLLEISEIST